MSSLPASSSSPPADSIRLRTCQKARLPEALNFLLRPNSRDAISRKGAGGNSARQPTGSNRMPLTVRIAALGNGAELCYGGCQQALGHVYFRSVVFERGRIRERHRRCLVAQIRTELLPFEEILDGSLAERSPGDSTENNARVFDRLALKLEPHRQRGHGEIPDAPRPEFFKRGAHAGTRRRNHNLGQDFVVTHDVRLDPAVHHHVAWNKLLNSQFLHARRRREHYFGVQGNQSRRGVSGIYGVAEPPTHGRVVVAVVADRAVAKIPAVPPAGVASAQILAPNLLKQVASERRSIAQLRR